MSVLFSPKLRLAGENTCGTSSSGLVTLGKFSGILIRFLSRRSLFLFVYVFYVICHINFAAGSCAHGVKAVPKGHLGSPEVQVTTSRHGPSS